VDNQVMEEPIALDLEERIRKEIEALKLMPDSEIDTSETRILPPEAWAKATVGRFYRPVVKP
jgi:hypothetical protein